MQIMNAFERRFGHLAIPNLTYYLIGGQVIAFVLMYASPTFGNLFYLQGDLVLKGEWWRLVTMLFTPLAREPLWAAFAWYIYYLYGTGLEQVWGSFRYLVYLVVIYFATLVAAFLIPGATLSNTHIYTSLFLAFAYLFPDFQLLIFFVIPVKIKWLAYLACAGMAASLIFGSLPTKVLTLLSASNFFLFFGSDIRMHIADRLRQGSRKAGIRTSGEQTYMNCAACHATENDRKIFYYCHDCVPETCYCEDHIRSHTHKRLSS